MHNGDLEGKTVTLVVAQRPFETASDSGFGNWFSTLVPVLHDDGRRADAASFPANGDVWWMVLRPKREFAEPGRLLTGILELSEQAGTPGKAYYQIQADSVEAIRPAQFVEVLDLPPDRIAEARELVSRPRLLVADHPPLEQVYARWRGHLFGPLRVSSEAIHSSGDWAVTFSTARPDNIVLQIPEDALKRVPPGHDHRFRVEVSLTNKAPYHPHKNRLTHLCQYRLIPADDFRGLIPPGVPQLQLESNQAILNRAVRGLLSRARRQEFNRLLLELGDSIEGAQSEAPPEAAIFLKALHDRMGREEKEIEQLGQAVLASGLLKDQVRQAMERAEAEHIEKHAARLQTEIEEKVAAIRASLDDLEKMRQGVDEEMEGVRRQRLTAIEAELEQKRQEFARRCVDEESKLETHRHELDRQRQLLSENLTKVARDLSSNRDQIVNQFLAIAPLLQQLHLLNGPNGVAASILPATASLPAPSGAPVREAGPDRTFDLPTFVLRGPAALAVPEPAFFERFVRHTEASGFKYRRIDLAGFHLSAKCNDLTILGGLPGTGKSSLPRLYAEALSGDEADEGRRRYLHVGVSPSWLDMRDLIGYANALDRSFQPAESGLYPFLIWAQEEEARRGPDSRLYFVCLDEMNLAHVEHYFSGFLQALERPPGLREVRCFAPELVSRSDPFAAWPTLNLPRAVRFVGTVNFDETTKPLSQRLLDRSDLIRLRPSHVLDARDPALVRPSGPPVALRNYRDWVDTSAKLDRSLAELIDRLKDDLARLGCPLNPRRFAAVRRFVASAPPEICTPDAALDLQIAQRLLPQIRGLFRPGAHAALEGVQKTLESHPSGFPESLQCLAELRSSDYPADPFAEGP
jgi:hypothetical protein